jgi:hypothetical protein
MEDVQAAADQRVEDDTLSVTAAPQGTGLKVTPPELEYSLLDGYDGVHIPGGGSLSEPDAYPVPVWSLSVELPAGRQVQDVQLVGRSTPVVTHSLDLPVVVPAIDCACENESTALAEPSVAGWYPAQDRVLDWSVEKGPSGNSTLEIVLYPFNCYAVTGEALYYRIYMLAVETFDSAVRIESLKAAQGDNEPGQAVGLELVVSKSERPQNVIVQPSVRTRGTNIVLGGLPLETLHALSGSATVDLTWDTRRYAAGDYMIVVELLDKAGRLLDTAVTDLHLGTVDAQLTALTASQETFSPGDRITLQMAVRNTGTVPITGTAVFLVQQAEGLSATQMITAHRSAPRQPVT